MLCSIFSGISTVLSTNRLFSRNNLEMFFRFEIDGVMETRTPNPQNANLVLYQLSYNPSLKGMGLNGLEPLTPALSERCSNQLSYRP